jgi:hypothetical protein
MEVLSRRDCCVSGMSGEGDFRRAEIWSRVATVFVLIPMYNFFSVSRHFQSSEDDVTSLHNLYIT